MDTVQTIVMGLLPAIIGFLLGRYLFPNCKSGSATVTVTDYNSGSIVKGTVTVATSTPDQLWAYVYKNTATAVTTAVDGRAKQYPGVTGSFTLNNVPTDAGLTGNCLVAVWAVWLASSNVGDGPFTVPASIALAGGAPGPFSPPAAKLPGMPSPGPQSRPGGSGSA